VVEPSVIAELADAGLVGVEVDHPDHAPADRALLRRLAAETGGAFETAATSSQLQTTYSAIAAQLARTWDLTYLTPARPGDHVALHITVPGQGAANSSFTPPASAGSPPPEAQPSTIVPQTAVKSHLATLVIAAAAGLLVLLAFFSIAAAKKASWVRKRLDPHLGAAAKRSTKRSASGERMAVVTALVRVTERAFGNLRQWKSLRQLLERADVPLKTAEFAWIALASAVLAALVVAVASHSALFALVGFALGAAVPWFVIWFKAKRRLNAFENQLPDLLITLAASLKAGHSFRHGIQTVVDEGQPPAADEFKRVLTDARLGRPMDDSLVEMAERVGSKNFDFVITAVTIQRQIGGSLAGLFDMVADTVRQRQQFARRIRSLTAMGRMSAYVLVGLPFFLVVIMSLINPGYMHPLWHSKAGNMLVFAGLGMIAVGSLILKKIVSFRG
jgi:tight adherence protein B